MSMAVSWKKIDIKTKQGLVDLRDKAEDMGHYADFLHVVELIDEVERLRVVVEAQDLALDCAEMLIKP